MDAQARKKALYRAKLNANKLEKRIESPLVRYNEFDQPVCRVCDVVLKSESLWPAHQASRKHHEAINNVKANAAGLTRVNNAKVESPIELPKQKNEHSTELRDSKPEASMELPKRPSSVLPPDFFDNNKTKMQKTGEDLLCGLTLFCSSAKIVDKLRMILATLVMPVELYKLGSRLISLWFASRHQFSCCFSPSVDVVPHLR
ncbi:hypothetical protein CsSME_00006206 [Camellia sinensis var. sinensis]